MRNRDSDTFITIAPVKPQIIARKLSFLVMQVDETVREEEVMDMAVAWYWADSVTPDQVLQFCRERGEEMERL